MEKRAELEHDDDECTDTPLLVLGCQCLEKDKEVTEQKGITMDHKEEEEETTMTTDEWSDKSIPLVLLAHHDIEPEVEADITNTYNEDGWKVKKEPWTRPAHKIKERSPRSNPTRTPFTNIPEYCWPHVQMDSLLGQGSFSRVFQVHLVPSTMTTTTTSRRSKDIPRTHRALHCAICHPPQKCNHGVAKKYFFKHGDENDQKDESKEKPYYFALKCPTAEILGEDDSSSCSSSPYHDDDDDDANVDNDNDRHGKNKHGTDEKADSSSLLLQTLKDLSIETKLLSQCRHENILRLYGIVKLGGYDFPLLELLQRDTLADRIKTWRRQLQQQQQQFQGIRKRRFKNPLGWLFPTSQSNRAPVRNSKGQPPLSKKRATSDHDDPMAKLLERLGTIAFGVAQGMQYLHKNHIVLRDLKPDNIGFAIIGGGQGPHHDETFAGGTTTMPKIFDFGFARNIHDLQQQFHDLVTTGTGGFEIAGTAGYMPPEAILGTGVDLTVDVYAFGMVVWELCTLQDPSIGRPNHKNSTNEHIRPPRRRCGVGVGGPCKNLIPRFGGRHDEKRGSYNNVSGDDDMYIAKRYLGWQPSVESIRIPRLKRLLLECWAFHPSSRPNFGRILKVLKLVLQGAASARSIPTTSTTSTATMEELSH
jgi:serine/threonine protein kinase